MSSLVIRGGFSGTGRGVAQPGSASGLGPEGRGFESLRPDHFSPPECNESATGAPAAPQGGTAGMGAAAPGVTMPKPEMFRFRKLDTIGAPDAQQDHEFLSNCFVDTGLLEVLKRTDDSRRIVVGRTGSGKTALIQRLCDTTQNVIVLPPEQLAIGYIANSNILQFVQSLGGQTRHLLSITLATCTGCRVHSKTVGPRFRRLDEKPFRTSARAIRQQAPDKPRPSSQLHGDLRR